MKYNCVVTIYNILYLSEFIEFAHKTNTGRLELDNLIDLIPCHAPEEQSINTLPTELKNLARDRLLGMSLYPLIKNKIDGIINYMYEPPERSWKQVMDYTNKLDELRNENVLDMIPEFIPFWTNSKT